MTTYESLSIMIDFSMLIGSNHYYNDYAILL